MNMMGKFLDYLESTTPAQRLGCGRCGQHPATFPGADPAHGMFCRECKEKTAPVRLSTLRQWQREAGEEARRRL